ncbi:CMGC/CDK/CDK5 protein kinase [Pseudoloma neurophilia]|uniref:CMGC/CDK/CDK5 protein kinase n=1 Tax=Pseudoloma neurophilia TaxID=146866 RepID=A0A0R0LS35_9MICR|nr:CMGC/CDK/CDK5 protein kinase [Pseudoloma neurophilia]
MVYKKEFRKSSYIQKRELGSGTYATVYLGICTENNLYVALKKIKINPTEGVPSTALREISALKALNHPNVIQLIEVIHSDVFLTMVFEYVEYDLKEYSNKFGFTQFLLDQLVSGLQYIHSMKIIHRDLKPQNILVGSDGILKIADFGLCRPMHLSVPELSNEVVTLWYRAPELLHGKKYSYEIDIFSIGTIVYEMVTGKVFLQGNDNSSQLTLIYNVIGNRKEFEKKLSEIHEPLFKKVIIGCCCISRESRWSIEDLRNMTYQSKYIISPYDR